MILYFIYKKTPHWSLSSNSHIMCGDDPQTCKFCGLVKHILMECANLRDIHAKYFTLLSVRELFESIDNHTVIDFIKETHFYHQLRKIGRYSITLNTNHHLYRVYILPVLLYGCKTQSVCDRLDAFVRWCHRRIFRLSYLQRVVMRRTTTIPLAMHVASKS